MPYFGAITLQDVYTDLESLPALPHSGKGLVSTLNAHRSTTRRNSAGRSAAPSGPDTLRHGVEETPNAEPPPHHEAPALLKELEKRTYVQAVAWVASKLADGLAHAHDRGIL